MTRFGIAIEICGIYVTSNKVRMDTATKGSTALDMSFNDTSAIPHPTYRLTPTGGVTSPIAIFITIIHPRCTASIPRLAATGKRIGTKM